MWLEQWTILAPPVLVLTLGSAITDVCTASAGHGCFAESEGAQSADGVEVAVK
jgi:hypothetical protein